MELFLQIIAAIGALGHVYFFYKEALSWDVAFVKKAAPTWIQRVGGDESADPYVEWASDLAINVGTYNLVLALGLAWVAIAGTTVAGTLGIFVAVWLLGAAAAAYRTKVYLAFYFQGALGVVLLIASLAQ
jgi:uncharacterized membrane protein